MIGKILGNRYEIIEKIGGGGMALVYKAKCNLLNRYVAIKVLRSEFVNDKTVLEKFRKESQASASLSHPNIVNIYDVGEEGDIYYIVMEYVEGKTLKEVIKKKGVLSADEILEFSRQIALALKHAHSNHIIHRDIKPHNILVTEDNRAKVTDFGIALAATSSTITNTGSVIGSVHYFSPEQARGGYTDEKSDLYSLGVVMYEMATGKVPFEGDRPVTVALKHIQEEADKPSEHNMSIPKGLEAIIIKLMQKEQSVRYSNASEVIEDLYKIKNNIDFDDIDNTLKIEDSPTQIIPAVTADEMKELTNSKDEFNSNNESTKNKGKKKDKRKLVIGSAIISALIAAIVFTFGFFYLSDLFKVENVEVPNFVSMNVEDAKELAGKVGLRLNISRKYDNTIPKDEVVNQLTSEGMKVKKGFEIKIIVSDGSKLATVPDLIYKTEMEAERMLVDEGLETGEVVEEFSELPVGTVIDQNPRANFKVAENSAVDYVISKGPEVVTINMPSLEGKTLEEAKNIISRYNLTLGDVGKEYSDIYEEGIVIDQNIGANTQVQEESVVNLIVSKGIEDEEVDEDTNENGPSARTISITLDDYTDTVNVEIFNIEDREEKLVYAKEHNIEEEGNTVRAQVTGEGSQEFVIYINGEKQETIVVDF